MASSPSACFYPPQLTVFWGSETAFHWIIASFLFVVFIIVVGGQKFLGKPGHTVHRMLAAVVSKRAYAAMEEGIPSWAHALTFPA